MKIGILNRSDSIGGAAVSASRLYVKLKEKIFDIKYLIGVKQGKNESILLHYKADYFAKLRNYVEHLFLDKRNGSFPFSLGLFPFPLNLLIKYHKIDILHLHWIGAGFVSIRSLSKIEKPIVWTMHDSWSFTGGCHIPYACTRYLGNCGQCPELVSKKENDLSRYLFQKKKNSYDQIQNITFVSPSKWLAEAASKSSLLCNRKIVVIPNGIDTLKFNPRNKIESRAILHIQPESKIILFGAVDSTSDKNKGYSQLLSALDLVMTTDFEILVFGSKNIEILEILGKKTHFLGRICDEDMMATIYSAADVTIVPSLSENLSNVIMESLSCATPVVAFNIGGNSDMIDHRLNGYLAEPYQTTDLANGIDWILSHPNIGEIKRSARNKVVECFDINIIANKHIELYNSIIK